MIRLCDSLYSRRQESDHLREHRLVPVAAARALAGRGQPLYEYILAEDMVRPCWDVDSYVPQGVRPEDHAAEVRERALSALREILRGGPHDLACAPAALAVASRHGTIPSGQAKVSFRFYLDGARVRWSAMRTLIAGKNPPDACFGKDGAPAPLFDDIYSRERLLGVPGCPKSASDPRVLQIESGHPLELLLALNTDPLWPVLGPSEPPESGPAPPPAPAPAPLPPAGRTAPSLQPSCAASLLKLVSDASLSGYADWLALAMACHSNVGADLWEVFDARCARAPGYDAAGNRRVWDSLGGRPASPAKDYAEAVEKTTRTLLWYARRDSPDEFAEVWGAGADVRADVVNASRTGPTRLRDAVLALGPGRSSDPATLRAVLGAIANVARDNAFPTDGARIAHEFASQASAYDPAAVDRALAEPQKASLGFATILAYLKQDQPALARAFSPRPDQLNATRLLTAFRGLAVHTATGFYLYNARTGVWTCDPLEHLGLVEGLSVLEGDGSFSKLFHSAYEIFRSHCPRRDDWLMSTSQCGFLNFRNGVLDMYARRMVPHAPEFCFTLRIERDFHPGDLDAEERTLRDRVFGAPFRDPGIVDFFLQKLARATAGWSAIRDREFLVVIGPPNCGKGTIAAVAQAALGPFCRVFNAENLSLRSAHAESERSWGFAAEIWDARLAVSSEMKLETESTDRGRRSMVRLDGNKLKQLVSAGDSIKGRHVYGRSFEFKNRACPMIMVNDLPEVSPADAAYLSRAIYLEADRGSSADATEVTDTEFPADPAIKDYAVSPGASRAFVSLMCKWYRLSVDSPLPRPAAVVACGSARSGADRDGSHWVHSRFDVFPGPVSSLLLPSGSPDWSSGWCEPVDGLFDAYVLDGGSLSRVSFGRLLCSSGLLIFPRKFLGCKSQWALGLRRGGSAPPGPPSE